MSGTLYLCATPIGNLGDITQRVLDTLAEVDLIAVEDTRNTIKLLNHFKIKKQMTSYHEFNKFEKAEELIALFTTGEEHCIGYRCGNSGDFGSGRGVGKKVSRRRDSCDLPARVLCTDHCTYFIRTSYEEVLF